MRLDQYLKEKHNIQSRNKASELVKANKVLVNETPINKPSYKVLESDVVQILQEEFYVSRAAYKLKYFLEDINLDITNLKALDIGSSTGGFTQILLEKKAQKVTCIDVGSNQLHPLIKNDLRICMYENTDIRDFQSNEYFDLVTCDVSFISILNILPSIVKLAQDKIIILYKPQFEVGRNVKRDSKGVVTDQEAIQKARTEFLDRCNEYNWKLQKNLLSSLAGKSGNVEELFYFTV